MTWIKIPPTEPGWYWVKGINGIEIVRVIDYGPSGLYFLAVGSEAEFAIGEADIQLWHSHPIECPELLEEG